MEDHLGHPPEISLPASLKASLQLLLAYVKKTAHCCYICILFVLFVAFLVLLERYKHNTSTARSLLESGNVVHLSMGFRIAIDPHTSKRLIYVLFAVQACVVGGISYQHRHGNPLRMGIDEHGVMRFQSMREYLSDEVKVSAQHCKTAAHIIHILLQYEELRLQDSPADEARMYDLQVSDTPPRHSEARYCSLEWRV